MTDVKMSTKYNPQAVEEGRYEKWVDSGVSHQVKIRKQSRIQLLFHLRTLRVSST